MDAFTLYGVVVVSLIGAGALIGFFWTKTEGFGPHTTSTLLLILVIVFSALLFLTGKLGDDKIVNLFFAIVGFAGGLFTRMKFDRKKKSAGDPQQKSCRRQ